MKRAMIKRLSHRRMIMNGEFPVCRSLMLKLQRKHTGRHMTLKKLIINI